MVVRGKPAAMDHQIAPGAGELVTLLWQHRDHQLFAGEVRSG
jgi:hypothetical protein